MEIFSEGITGLYIFIAMLVCMTAILTFLIRKSPTKRQYWGNILIPCVFIALALFFYVITWSFPEEEAGPSAVPHLWVVVLIILSAFLVFQALTGKVDPDPKSGRLDILGGFIGAVILYLVVMQILGYYIATFIFLVLVMHFLPYKKYHVIFAVAAGWLLFAYIVFQRMLYIPLPPGKLIEMVMQ